MRWWQFLVVTLGMGFGFADLALRLRSIYRELHGRHDETQRMLQRVIDRLPEGWD